ncbi:tellurium resistance protein [Methylacidiphilum kamchatkense Kam1]|uniref:Tellurite resistance protein TerC n=1 Tax=Methylacidiphilum kamchatkense Kam1 TaxID=1202785 RepID=A0A0C1V2H4_9BACT|nr:tellurium resistance protein [Methylacidiphilum kamchatkense]KIE57850.1 tellurium resistance protein [Methylacidiphilum kamchatkense Kam1]QDQ41473.1 tellurite resistance protein TerC [Methylacidiphilum kamchatkense Kam1]
MDLFYILFFSLLLLGIISQIFGSFLSTGSLRESTLYSLLWVLFSLFLGLWLGIIKGVDKAFGFFAVFWIEYLLSIDNLILFHVIFEFSQTAESFRHKLLSLGIFSAIFLRILLIVFGLFVASRWSVIFPLFGLFLFFAAYRLARPQKDKPPRLLGYDKKIFFGPFVYEPAEKTKFLFKEGARIGFGSLALTFLAIETTDILFALDSVPASFAITTDPLLLISGNICGVFGLRSLYFLVERTAKTFVSFNTLSALLLVLMGIELLIKPWLEISPFYSFCSILSLCLAYGLMKGIGKAKNKPK